jgi:hypothetical protein
MTSEAQAALGENVTKLIDEWPNRSSESIASAAIDIVLEEAARVAQSRAQLPSTGDRVHDAGWDGACVSIAAAIRALKGSYTQNAKRG